MEEGLLWETEFAIGGEVTVGNDVKCGNVTSRGLGWVWDCEKREEKGEEIWAVVGHG